MCFVDHQQHLARTEKNCTKRVVFIFRTVDLFFARPRV